MARKTIFTWIGYDAHGELLGYLTDKPTGPGLVTVHHPSGRTMYVHSSQIGRYEVYNLAALMRYAEGEQEAHREKNSDKHR